MKNTQSNKKIEARVRKAYESLPQWAKDVLGEDTELTLKNTMHSIQFGLNRDPNTGERYSPKTILLNRAKDTRKFSNGGTKRKVFKMFREQQPAIYSRLNSYMYRRGYSFSSYFYQNATIKREKGDYIIISNLEIPQGNSNRNFRVYISELEITVNFHNYPGEEVNANLYF